MNGTMECVCRSDGEECSRGGGKWLGKRRGFELIEMAGGLCFRLLTVTRGSPFAKLSSRQPLKSVQCLGRPVL